MKTILYVFTFVAGLPHTLKKNKNISTILMMRHNLTNLSLDIKNKLFMSKNKTVVLKICFCLKLNISF